MSSARALASASQCFRRLASDSHRRKGKKHNKKNNHKSHYRNMIKEQIKIKQNQKSHN